MSIAVPPAADILRGMHVEAVPLRLSRIRPGLAQPMHASPEFPAEAERERARRECLEEAARQGHEEGSRAGYEAGLRKGLTEAAGEVQAAVQKAVAQAKTEVEARQGQLDALAAGLQRAMQDMLVAAEDEMVALCFDTLCRMVGTAAAQQESMRAQIVALASQVAPRDLVAVHVHPEDHRAFAGGDASPGAIPWVADPEVRTGGCIVRRKGGGLDARLDSMLEACRAALIAARAQRRRAGGDGA